MQKVIPSRVIFQSGTEEVVNARELKILHQCGLLARVAVNERWHTDHEDDVRKVLTNLRTSVHNA